VEQVRGERVGQWFDTEFGVSHEPAGFIAQVEITESASVVVEDGATVSQMKPYSNMTQLAGPFCIARDDTARHTEIDHEA
jgi:hypothetical protein